MNSAEKNTSPYYAALDLGSNSFHLLIVRLSENGIQEVDKIKHMVRLGEGLGKDGILDHASIQRALDALTEMGQRIAHIPCEQVRAVATNTLRVARNGRAVLGAAETALGTEIEIINGQEEARLIYLGITTHNHFKERNLVIDVGGGSTELIVGSGGEAEILRSMKMGCINMVHRFFPRGKISKNAIKKALAYVGKTIEPHMQEVLDSEWQRSILSSGTAKNIERVLQRLNLSESGVSRKNLDTLLGKLSAIERADKLPDKLGISAKRAFGFTGGVCILAGLFAHLEIKEARVSQQALREGVLLDLIGTAAQLPDQRQHTVRAMQKRFNVDSDQARRVDDLCAYLNRQMPLKAPPRIDALLGFTAGLHEIGLAVARGKHQNHGAYLIANADMPGFSRILQEIIATLIKGQRKKIPAKQIEELPEKYRAITWQFLLALRLSVLLYRPRADIPVGRYPQITGSGTTVTVTFREGFLAEHPLTVSDLLEEQGYWEQDSPFELRINPPVNTAQSEPSR